MKTLQRSSVITVDGELERVAQRLMALLNAPSTEWAQVLVEHGETDLSGFEEHVAEVADVLAELRVLFATPDRDTAARRLNDLLEQHAGRPRLVTHEGWDWHLHVDHVDDTWAGWLAASSALALAVRLVDRPDVPWGTCAADDCARVFLDNHHGGGRSYCSPRCATRQRVRRHRSRSA